MSELAELINEIVKKLILLFKGYVPEETPSEEEPTPPPQSPKPREKPSVPLDVLSVSIRSTKDTYRCEDPVILITVNFNRKPEYGDPPFLLQIYANNRRVLTMDMYPIVGANPSVYDIALPLEPDTYDIFVMAGSEESNHITITVLPCDRPEEPRRAPPRRRRGIEPIPY